MIVIVLGRGRLQGPSKGLDALTGFIRALPSQERVAVLAYGRASDLTTDHDSVGRFIDLFKANEEALEGPVEFAMSNSLGAVYGARVLPLATGDRIQQLFINAGLGESKSASVTDNAALRRAARDVQDATQRGLDKQRQVEQQLNTFMPSPGQSSQAAELEAAAVEVQGLGAFIYQSSRSLQDLGSCYAAIEYLRYLEGTKQLILVTERGLNLPRVENDSDLVRAANDARVAINIIQTGGIMGQIGSTWTDQSQQTFAFAAIRGITAKTGGIASIAEDGAIATRLLNSASQGQYTLGYYPVTSRLDGKYRRIEVKTRRRGTTLFYRQGYYARAVPEPYNRRESITRERVRSALDLPQVIDDLRLTLTTTQERNPDGVNVISVRVIIDLSQLSFVQVDGKRKAEFDIAVRLPGQSSAEAARKRIDVELTAEAYERAFREGLSLSISIPTPKVISGAMRLVVYNYSADRIGGLDRWLK